jgi:hypothetical protein
MMRVTFQVGICLLLAVSVTSAQDVRRIVLGPLQLTTADPFSRIAGLAELPDGRIVVVDPTDREIRVVSASGRVSRLSREGRGPREYLRPFGVIRGPGDTLFIYDQGNRKFLRIAPNGVQLEDVPIPSIFVSRGGLAPPKGIDARGRIYWAGDVLDPVRGADGRIKRAVAQNVRRWTVGTERLDTVARVADHAEAMHHHPFHPFAERDAFVVSPDGAVGILSASEYRLRWLRDGAMILEGPPIAFEPISVTAAERTAFRAERVRSPAGGALMRGRDDRDARGATRRSVEQAYPDGIFPARKPPFTEGGAIRAPTGEIWVTLSMPHSATRGIVEVLSPAGDRVGQVTLPPGRRLVAVDRGGVYLVRTDDDGLEWLERYGLPRM